MSDRPYISLKKKLASALCQMLRPDANGKLVPVIDHVSAKAMTVDQILSIFHWDHYPIPVHRGGPGEHWNLVPRPIPEHREKTSRIDTPGAAKDKRIKTRQEEFRRKMLAKTGQEEEPPSQRQKRHRLRKPEGARYDWERGRYVRD